MGNGFGNFDLWQRPQLNNDHVVKSYDEELSHLAHTIAKMGGLAEAQLQTAIEALVRRDAAMADQVVQSDARIDELEHEVSLLTMRMLALRQPVGQDLREVVAALKISSDIERIGDYAANIGKRTLALSQVPPLKLVSNIPRLGRLVQQLIKDVLDAYIEHDRDKAVEAWQRDEEVDELHTSLFREFLTYMMEDSRNINPCTHLLFIAKNIERIGDHATNIAEAVHFLVRGQKLDAPRPKGDETSFSVIFPPERGSHDWGS